MALTKLDPNVIGQDSTGTGKITSAGGSVSIDSSGNVRIANASANSVLFAANGFVGVGNTSPAQDFVLQSSSSGQTLLNIINTSTGGYSWNIGTVGSAAGLGPVGSFVVRDSTNGANRFSIDASGNVGIGITSPTTIVHAKAPINTDGIITIDSTSTNVSQRVYLSSNGTVGAMFYNDSSQVVLRSQTAKPLLLGANGSNFVTVAANGNVGISCTSPTVALSIYGSDPRQAITSSGDSSTLVLGQWDGTTNRIESAGRTLFLTSYSGGVSLGASGSQQHIFNASGKVGLGTTSPSSKVQIAGSMSSPSSTDILPTALLSITGGGGDYLSIGQYTNSHFWMQGGYLNPSLAKYNILMQPLGGKVGVGTTSPDEQLTSVGRRGMVQPSDSVRRCVEFHTYISASTTNTDVFAVDVGTLNHGFYYEIIVTGSDWSNHSAARVIKRGFHCPNTGYTAHSVVESSGPHAANIIYDYGLSGNVFTGKLRLDTGSVTLHCYVRLIGRIASYSVYGTE